MSPNKMQNLNISGNGIINKNLKKKD